MRVALGALLDAVLAGAPEALFSPQAIATLRGREAWLDPPAVGFECRLAGPDAVDLGLLSRPDPDLPGAVDAVFYEWDQLPSRELREAPLVFYRFGTGISRDEARRAIAALTGSEPADLDGLPDGAKVTDFGRLDARATGWARIGIVTELAAARALLADAGWGAPGRAMDALLADLAAVDRHVRVQVDLAPLRFVGIELLADQSPRGAGWSPLLELLEGYGLCDRARGHAVARWPRRAPAQLEGLGWCAIDRVLSHLKVSRAHDGALQAKAYLFAAASPPGASPPG